MGSEHATAPPTIVTMDSKRRSQGFMDGLLGDPPEETSDEYCRDYDKGVAASKAVIAKLDAKTPKG